jgi:5-methyltetrahydrofolate--homocysteine methyltransferase
MIIVGELINSTRKSIAEFIRKRDTTGVSKVGIEQVRAGADYVDVNAGIFVGGEGECLKWLVKTVQSAVHVPCCIDSPNPEAIEAAISVHRGTPMINSISLEKTRYDRLLPILAGTDMKVIALCMSDEGMPQTAVQRLQVADKLINGLVANRVPLDNIFVDPLVQPIAASTSFGCEFLDAIERINEEFKGVHTICGVSNISYGLPEREFLNEMFMVMSITKGLDGAIVNPLDRKMMAAIITAETLKGRDEFCARFLDAFRSGRLEF